MGSTRCFWLSLVLSVVLLAMFVGESQTYGQDAKDRAKVELVPNVSHSAEVPSVAFSPDGARLVSGSSDMTLKLWDGASGQLIRTFQGHFGRVTSVAFSSDGTRLLSGSSDMTLRLWDAASGQLVRTFQGHAAVISSVALSHDGTRLLSGQEDATLAVWDAASGERIHILPAHSKRITSVAFSADGARLISASADRTLKLWDAASMKLLRTFEGHSGEVVSVTFSADGARVLSGSRDNTLRLWDAATGQPIHNLEGHSGAVVSVAFSPDGKLLLSGSEDKTLRLWDAATGRPVRTFDDLSGGIASVAFSPDGKLLLSDTLDKTLWLWDPASGQAVRTTLRAGPDGVTSVAFLPDGKRMLLGSRDAMLWDAASGQPVRTLQGHADGVSSVAVSPNGTRLLSGSWDKTLKLWDAAKGQPIRTFEGHSGMVSSVALSRDGARVLSGGWDNTLRLWDTGSGQAIHTLQGHSSIVDSVAFSPDGTRLLSGSHDATIKLWDAATGQLIHTLEGHAGEVMSVAFSPDGSQVLSGSRDATLKLWDAESGQQVRTFEGHSDMVTSVAFSPDGTRLLSGSWDKTVRLWGRESGQLLRTYEGQSGPVWSAAFSPDGARMLSGAWDGTVLVWDAKTGQVLARLYGSRSGHWLAMTPAGFLAASSKGAEMLGVVRGLDATTIGQVHQSLYNPDLVRAALAGDPDKEVAGAAKMINLEKVLDSGPAPQAMILSPADTSQSTKDVVAVATRIEDRGKSVGRIEWRVNGITARVAAKPSGSGPVYTVTQRLALDPGDNTIEVVAYNGSNLLASLPARTTVKFTGPPDKTKPKLHILAIGINAYVDKGWTRPGSKTGGVFPPLDLAVRDAKAFAARMKKAAGGVYDKVRVTLMLDQDANRDNLPKIIDKIAAQIHPRDTFILFAAAHGYSLKGRFYLIPQDYQGGPNPEALAARAIGQEQLQDWLANRIKARRAIILLDTCQSGALVAGHQRSRIDAPASEAAVGRLHEATGRPVLTAAAAGQDAIEGVVGADGEKHGVFTSAILDALRKGDANGDGLIELSELVGHVQRVVPKLAAEMDEKQAARFGSRGENFVVARRLP